MQSVENISQWNELDKKSQMVYLTEIKIRTVKRKIRKKETIKRFLDFVNKRVTVALATKSRLQ